MTDEHSSDDEASIDPEILFGLTDGDDLEVIEDATLTLRGPNGDVIEEATTDEMRLYRTESELTGMVGNTESVTQLFAHIQRETDQ